MRAHAVGVETLIMMERGAEVAANSPSQPTKDDESGDPCRRATYPTRHKDTRRTGYPG